MNAIPKFVTSSGKSTLVEICTIEVGQTITVLSQLSDTNESMFYHPNQ